MNEQVLSNDVLLIDSNATIHRLFEITLDSYRYELINEYNAEDGLTAAYRLNSLRGSIIIVDNAYLDIQGYIADLKEASPTSKIVVLVTSSSAYSANRDSVQLDGYILKPINLFTLNDVLKEIIAGTLMDKLTDPASPAQSTPAATYTYKDTADEAMMMSPVAETDQHKYKTDIAEDELDAMSIGVINEDDSEAVAASAHTGVDEEFVLPESYDMKISAMETADILDNADSEASEDTIDDIGDDIGAKHDVFASLVNPFAISESNTSQNDAPAPSASQEELEEDSLYVGRLAHDEDTAEDEAPQLDNPESKYPLDSNSDIAGSMPVYIEAAGYMDNLYAIDDIQKDEGKLLYTDDEMIDGAINEAPAIIDEDITSLYRRDDDNSMTINMGIQNLLDDEFFNAPKTAIEDVINATDSITTDSVADLEKDFSSLFQQMGGNDDSEAIDIDDVVADNEPASAAMVADDPVAQTLDIASDVSIPDMELALPDIIDEPVADEPTSDDILASLLEVPQVDDIADIFDVAGDSDTHIDDMAIAPIMLEDAPNGDDELADDSIMLDEALDDSILHTDEKHDVLDNFLQDGATAEGITEEDEAQLLNDLYSLLVEPDEQHVEAGAADEAAEGISADEFYQLHSGSAVYDAREDDEDGFALEAASENVSEATYEDTAEAVESAPLELEANIATPTPAPAQTSGFKMIEDAIFKELHPDSDEAALLSASDNVRGVLSMDIPMHDIEKILERSINKIDLKNIVEVLVKESLDKALVEILPEVAERIVKEEIKLIKDY